ncbi:enoyl-CoA hydratase-related protein [Muricoccus radiodurans]|uniref:enoyl-CoA hydratase-related protein n=1 Tax=Muricoccus radiodurans TaxID=2231721 RepID=UPI003CF53DD2
MSKPFLRESQHGSILMLEMDAPEDRNALSWPSQCDEFIEACRRVNADRGVKVVILTGTGNSFCSGGNVKHMRSHEGFMAGSIEEIEERYRSTLQQVALSLHGLEVPLIAAVNGPAMGAGLDIACMCDVRIAAESARFAETFVRLGLISGIGGAWFLPRVVGPARAAELSFTARIFDAAQALNYGLISEVLPDDQLRGRAIELAGEIAAHSGIALRFAKRLLRMGERSDLRGTLDVTAALQAVAHQTPEHRAAIEAFFETRLRC